MAAYQLRYYYQYYDLGGLLHRVELWQYSTETTFTYTFPIVLSEGSHAIEKGDLLPTYLRCQGTDKTNIDTTYIQGLQFKLNFYYPTSLISDLDAIFEADHTDIKVKYYIDSQLEFEGYLQPDNLSRDFIEDQSYMYIQLFATDGLATLKNIEFTDSSENVYTIKVSQLETIKYALLKLGIELDFNIQLNTYESNYMASTDNPLDKILINLKAYYTDTAEGRKIEKCWDVIEDILKQYNCVLKQYKGQWKISNYHEYSGTSAYEFLFDWSTLTQQSRTLVNNTIDISTGYKVKRETSLQKVRPLRVIKTLFKDKYNADDITGFDMSDWVGTWNITANSHSVDSLGNLEVTSFNANGWQIVLKNPFWVANLASSTYLRLAFDIKLVDFGYSGTPSFSVLLEIQQPDTTWRSPEIISITNHNWQSYANGDTATFLVAPNGNYNIRLTCEGDSGSTDIMLFQITPLLVLKSEDGTLLDTPVTYNWNYTQKLTGAKVYDVLEITDKVSDFRSLLNYGDWRTYGNTEDVRLMDIMSRNILNNRYKFKNFIKGLTIIDRGNTLGFNNILVINSRKYRIAAFERNGMLGEFKCDLVELLTASQPYNPISKILGGTET